MNSLAEVVRKGKKQKVLREVKFAEADEFERLDRLSRLDIIKNLIPLGLMHVSDELEREVEELAGPWYSRQGGDPALARHGSNPGSVRLAGQKLRIKVPRVRNIVADREVPLETMQAVRGSGEVNQGLLRRVLYGLSCRNYEAAAEAVPGAIGLSASSVSRQFVRASANKLRELNERDVASLDIVALIVDGKAFAEDAMVTALGITFDGRKVILGFVQAGTENQKVLTQFFRGMIDRGLSIDEGLLVVIDGSKGLRAAVREAFGRKAFVQRCEWHKRENVVQYLPKNEQAAWRKRLQRGYDRPTYDEAKAALLDIRQHLEQRNQSAAASLDEGFEETLTLHRLGVFAILGKSLKTVNCVESLHSMIDTRCRKVCHWKNSSQKQRWLASALLDIEPRLHRVRGWRNLGLLRDAIKLELGLVKQEGVA